jgi:hypothetical protein
MKRYYHQSNYSRHQRTIQRLKITLLVVFGIALLGGLALGVDYYRHQFSQKNQKATTTETNGYYSAPVQIFRTPYFQFQTDNSWSEITNESQSNVFVYRGMSQHLVEHELTVYVNIPLENLTATHVLPVNLSSTGQLLSLPVSDKCEKAFKGTETKTIKSVIMHEVTFVCDPHDSSYRVVVGTVKGGPHMKLHRPDGTTATYTIVYRNITALPDASQLQQIVNSFQTR